MQPTAGTEPPLAGALRVLAAVGVLQLAARFVGLAVLLGVVLVTVAALLVGIVVLRLALA